MSNEVAEVDPDTGEVYWVRPSSNGSPPKSRSPARKAELTQFRAQKFTPISAAELATSKYDLSYLVEDVLVDGQPLVVGGPKKALKTSIAVDLAVSLATGKMFLNRFAVRATCKVLVCSAESGLATLQETASRISAAKGVELASIDSLVFIDAVPMIAEKHGNTSFFDVVRPLKPDVIILDPFYRMMSGEGAENLYKVGNPLASFCDCIIKGLGATPIILHHLKSRRDNPTSPADLDDLSYAGCAEFFRQWMLISRREKYEDGSGLHKLWLNAGGSAGHSSAWSLDIDEGRKTDEGGRRWVVSASSAAQARKREEAAKVTAKESAVTVHP